MGVSACGRSPGRAAALLVAAACVSLVPAVASVAAAPAHRRPGRKPTHHKVRAVESGVQGTALIGPVAPVSRPGVPDEKPLAGALVVVREHGAGREVARVRTDAAGRFHLRLPPGDYDVQGLPPNPGSRLPHGATEHVTLSRGRTASVRLHYDSGIR